MIELMLKVAAGAVTAVLCGALVRRGAAEFSLVLVLAALGWILLQTGKPLGGVLDVMKQLTRLGGLDSALTEPVVKVVGLSIITRVTVELCRGAGESGVAAVVELAGTVLALGAMLPLVGAVVELVAGLLG